MVAVVIAPVLFLCTGCMTVRLDSEFVEKSEAYRSFPRSSVGTDSGSISHLRSSAESADQESATNSTKNRTRHTNVQDALILESR